MTLVEVMISTAVFAIAILGAYGLLVFALRTMDATRTFTQVTQILTHEMEAMRMRRWSDAAGGTTATTTTSGLTTAVATTQGQVSVKYMGKHMGDFETFTPFADYSGGDVFPGNPQPVLSTKVLGTTTLQLRNATGFKCTRKVVLDATEDSAEIVLTVSWNDARNAPHARSFISTVSKKGLNDSIFLSR